MEDEDLVLDKLASGDRPSVYAAGVVAAQALKQHGLAVFMTDVLGRVFLLPPDAVIVKRPPRLPVEELDLLEEHEALMLLSKQGDTEDEKIEYLKGRDTRLARGGL